MNIRAVLLCMLILCASRVAAQELVVSKSPVSPDTTHSLSGEGFEQPLLAVRLEAVGGDVTVEDFDLTVSGTGSPTTQMTGLSVWLDDGDGEFDTQTDTELWSGPSAATVTVTLAPALLVGEGLYADVWVVAAFSPDAGSSVGTTYSVGIADTSDVAVDPGATVDFGAEPPQSTELLLVLFRVDSVELISSGVIIEGSGFTPPIALHVSALRLEGTYEVSPDHSRVVFMINCPHLSPTASPTLEISTALVTRYQTSVVINVSLLCHWHNSPIYDRSCTAAATPIRIPAILLLAALMFAAARVAAARSATVPVSQYTVSLFPLTKGR